LIDLFKRKYATLLPVVKEEQRFCVPALKRANQRAAWSVLARKTFEANFFLPGVSVLGEVLIYAIDVRACRAQVVSADEAASAKTGESSARIIQGHPVSS
jgi:hypothetical protein